MNDPILSICVPTYNHEKYIAQALDSILMQETSYPFEVIVGEDCSPDNTRAILKEYERKYPERFTVLYREHNMYKEFPDNQVDIELRCRGKYVIGLEGDDYWTDPLKLDKQIRFLEEHPEYIAVAHNCTVVDENSEPKDEVYPACQDEEYTFRHFVSEIMPGQTTTVMYRNIYRGNDFDKSLLNKHIIPGDRVYYFWMLINGKIYCMHETMSAYRHITDQGTSFSATTSYCFQDTDYYCRSLLEYARSVRHAEACMVAEDLCLRNLLQGLKHKQCTQKEFWEGLKLLSHKPRLFVRYIRYKINKDILCRQFWI